MKKTAVIMLALCLILTLGACGKMKKAAPAEKEAKRERSEQTAQSPAAEKTEEKTVPVTDDLLLPEDGKIILGGEKAVSEGGGQSSTAGGKTTGGDASGETTGGDTEQKDPPTQPVSPDTDTGWGEITWSSN